MLNTQERAEVYRLGLIIGQFDPPEVVAWADEVIAQEDKVDDKILDVSMAQNASNAKMVALLREAAGNQVPGKPRDVLFGLLADKLAKDESAANEIAFLLKTLVSAYDVPDSILKKASELAAPFAFDEVGAKKQLAEFLGPYRRWAADWK